MTAFGRPHSTSLRRCLLAAGMAGAVLLTASCSGADGDDGVAPMSDDGTSSTRDDNTTSSRRPTSTTSTAPTTSTTTSTGAPLPAAEQEIIDRYVAFWQARFAANIGTPNPADPALTEYATGSQLSAVIEETQANLDQGLAFRARSDPADFRRVTIVSVAGDEAVVQECFVDDGLVIERASGNVVNDTIATQNVRGELRRVDGEWRVSGSRLIQRWEGVDGCALAS